MKKLWLFLFIFLVGIGLGLGAPSLAPQYLGQYFPTGLSATRAGVEGVVVKKQSEEARLLLTISAPDGALLATFEKKITEISLLVDEGDVVTLDTRVYAPFVTDPPILRVKKSGEFSSPELGPSLDETPIDRELPVSPPPILPEPAPPTDEQSEPDGQHEPDQADEMTGETGESVISDPLL
ncbi:MAG: hypothetical protein NPIRA02_21560 [Nitrospirales bacterium]|nr:MAG: hypothetical protein NPIRA02_21560 [Nitrospirales bacterium]